MYSIKALSPLASRSQTRSQKPRSIQSNRRSRKSAYDSVAYDPAKTRLSESEAEVEEV